MSDARLTDDGLCFGCGPRNETGLKLTFAWDGDTCVTTWTPRPEHQGWADRVHGGLLALMLDEVLSHAALERHGLYWVTAELTTRLKRPALVGHPLRAQAKVIAVRSRLIVCEGDIRTEDGLVVATGSAKLMRPERDHPMDTPVETTAETPLEAAARREAAQNLPQERAAAQARHEEQEADRLVADIDAYVARTDPDSLPEAEQALNDWQIPTDPLEGIPDNVALNPEAETEPLVAVLAAGSEMEANIVRGLLEAAGIPATFDGLPSPMLGNVFQAGETRWADVLVPARLADQARAAIAEATASDQTASDEPASTEPASGEPVPTQPTEVHHHA